MPGRSVHREAETSEGDFVIDQGIGTSTAVGRAFHKDHR